MTTQKQKVNYRQLIRGLMDGPPDTVFNMRRRKFNAWKQTCKVHPQTFRITRDKDRGFILLKKLPMVMDGSEIIDSMDKLPLPELRNYL